MHSSLHQNVTVVPLPRPVLGVTLVCPMLPTLILGSVASWYQVVNFRNWQMAMLVLWRCSLGNWRGLMYDTMVQEPSCTVIPAAPGDGDELNDCGNYYMAVLYFVSFQIASTFCVLNLVIGIILGAFTWCYSLEPSEITGNLKISAQHLRHCKISLI